MRSKGNGRGWSQKHALPNSSSFLQGLNFGIKSTKIISNLKYHRHKPQLRSLNYEILAGSITEDTCASRSAECLAQSHNGAHRGSAANYLSAPGREEPLWRTSSSRCHSKWSMAAAILSWEWATTSRAIPLHLQYILQREMERARTFGYFLQRI